MAVRHRCLAVSGPLGVRVGRSAALRGPSEPAGVLQGTPGNQNSARQTSFLSVADCARPAAADRSGVRMDCNRGNPRAVVGLLFRADCRCRPPDHRSRSRRQHAHHRAHELGIRPAPRSPGTVAWPSAGRSASESAAQRPSETLPNPRRNSRLPPEIRIVPVKRPFSASPTARDPPLRTAPASAWTAIGATCVQSSGRCPSRLPLPGADHRSRSWQQHRAHELGHSAPSRSSGAVARPPAGRSASESAAQRLSEGLPNPQAYSRVPPKSE